MHRRGEVPELLEVLRAQRVELLGAPLGQPKPDDTEVGPIARAGHEPAGLGYQLELRKETKGQFDFFYDQRLDGAWVALIRRKML